MRMGETSGKPLLTEFVGEKLYVDMISMSETKTWKINRKKMIGKNQINGRGYLRWCFPGEYQIYILEVIDVHHQNPLQNTKEADVAHGKV